MGVAGGPTDGADNNNMNNFPLRGCKGGYFDGGMRAVGLVHGAGLQAQVVGTGAIRVRVRVRVGVRVRVRVGAPGAGGGHRCACPMQACPMTGT